MDEINSIPAAYTAAIHLIDDAHSKDPRDRVNGVPYELDYAQKMTRWLARRKPDASPVLQVACRAQHFRRWEIPRSSYPMTRPGYLTWRAKLKSQAAAQVAELLKTAQDPLPQEEIDRVAALIRKENLKADEETQILEDVACLVFLDDQFDNFEKKPEIDEDKIIGILRKTWAKMSPQGQALALQMHFSERAKILIQKALEPDA
ncbi:hypothetical protein QBC46DRAFT_287747 [Diplogelasinospora grovesii]|uniref:Glutamyl-tRNA synthetase n=1 Tax=Diplogelasinospora grovesii TaxID=303347 RepID=A0AAN6N7V5_9PEZI|nr:hypothetical protein QBC46DRAFT_287747 [Diplogelasinospora grovesii]